MIKDEAPGMDTVTAALLHVGGETDMRIVHASVIKIQQGEEIPGDCEISDCLYIQRK